MNISFTSTYRIPLDGLKPSKKEQVKKIALEYPPFILMPSGNKGAVRVSISQEKDASFEQKLAQHGIKVYQKFARHCILPYEMDAYIKICLDSRDYEPHGEQMRSNRKRR